MHTGIPAFFVRYGTVGAYGILESRYTAGNLIPSSMAIDSEKGSCLSSITIKFWYLTKEMEKVLFLVVNRFLFYDNISEIVYNKTINRFLSVQTLWTVPIIYTLDLKN